MSIMWKRPYFLVAIAFLAGVTISLVYLLWNGRPTAEQRLATNLVNSGLLTAKMNEPIQEALVFLLQGTDFQDRWQINGPPRRDFLNILILRPDISKVDLAAHPEVEPFRNNCAYIGQPNLIICDSNFFEDFLIKKRIVPTTSNPTDREKAYDEYLPRLLLWVLGHEIGHVVKHHAPAHFQENALEKAVAANSLAQQQELEADAFSIEQIKRDPDRLLTTENMLISVLNDDIRHKSTRPIPAGVGILYDYRKGGSIEYARKGTHPEYIVRCIRLLTLAPLAPVLTEQVQKLAQTMKEVK